MTDFRCLRMSLALTVLLGAPSAQAQDGPLFPGPCFDTPDGPYDHAIADFDGDGDPDIAVRLVTPRALAILFNLGEADFADRVVVGPCPFANDMVAVDLDNDGDADIAVAHDDQLSIFWNAGDGTFPDIDDSSFGARMETIDAGDLNGDGLADLALADTYGDAVFVLLNLGGRVFSSPVDYAAGDLADNVRIAEMTGDDYPDLVVTIGGSDAVGVLANGGAGTFALHTVVDAGVNPIDLDVADLDADGDLDVVVATNDGRVKVLRNEGGSLQPGVDVADFNVLGSLEILVLDCNGDGTPDIVASEYQLGGFSIFLNNGDASFARAPDVHNGPSGVRLTACDLDQDGHEDIALRYGDLANLIGAVMNDPSGLFVSQELIGLDWQPEYTKVGDFNADGHMDFAAANTVSGPLALFLNDGTGKQFEEVRLSVPSPIDLRPIDLNCDGWLDLALLSDQLHVLLSDGEGGYIEVGQYDVGDYPERLCAGDFENDGTLDLAVVGGDGRINVLSGIGDGSFTHRESLVFSGVGTDIDAADIDADGDADLVATAAYSDVAAVYLSLGDGSFVGPLPYGVDGFPTGVRFADLSGDGAVELVVSISEWEGEVWVFNNNGVGAFYPPVTYHVGRSPDCIRTSDLDADGDVDILVSTRDDAVSVLLNTGDGMMGNRAMYRTGDAPYRPSVADLDGDGLPEIIVVSFLDRAISVLSNLNEESCPGDANGDRMVNQSDLGILLATYELPPDDPLYDPRADFNDDGEVGQPDLGILLANYELPCD